MAKRQLRAKDIMTKEVISVHSDTSLVGAAKILASHNFDGLPVIDKQNKLIGILTEYDLINNGLAIHLPTLQTILQNFPVLKKDKSKFQKNLGQLSSLTVKDVMNKNPLTFSKNTTFEEVTTTFREHHRVNPIPVINKDKKVVGIVSRFDVLKPLHLIMKPYI